MDCPNCKMREMAMVQASEALVAVPADMDRLWCPQCGWVVERPIVKVAPVSVKKVVEKAPVKAKKAEKRVPRATGVARKAMKKLGGKTVQKGGKK